MICFLWRFVIEMPQKCHIAVWVVTLFLFQLGCETATPYRRSDFERGKRSQDEGRYGQATLYYRSYLGKNPSGLQAEEAHFRMGESLFFSGENSLALRQFERYQARYPSGRFSEATAAYLATILKRVEQVPIPSEMRSLAEREKEVERLEREVLSDSENVSLRLDLADAYIDLGQATLAERALNTATGKAENYAEMKRVEQTQGRLERLRNSQPLYATDLYGNPGPLRVRNAEGQLRREGTASDRRQRASYVVTGTVVNEGEKNYGRVQVQVTLYTFGNRGLATRTVSVGPVAPRGQRFFSVQIPLALPADEQVSRFECSLIY